MMILMMRYLKVVARHYVTPFTRRVGNSLPCTTVGNETNTFTLVSLMNVMELKLVGLGHRW